MTPCSRIRYIRFAGQTTPNSMMSHWERKWDSAQAYLSLPACRALTLGLGDGVRRCRKSGDKRARRGSAATSPLCPTRDIPIGAALCFMSTPRACVLFVTSHPRVGQKAGRQTCATQSVTSSARGGPYVGIEHIQRPPWPSPCGLQRTWWSERT